MKSSLLRFVALVAAPVAAEIQIYKYGLNSTATLSNGCTEALKGALNCDPYLQSLAAIDYYGPVGNNTLQDALCAASCGSSLSEYHDSVHKACANDPQPWDGIPAFWVGDIIWATYNRTCLKDETSGEYCTNEIGDIQESLGDADMPLTSLSKDRLCSTCLLALIKQMQNTAYSNYDAKLAVDWAEIQKTCGTGALPTEVQPPATNMTSIPSVDHSNPDNATCLSDNYYTVKSGDNVQAIAEAQGVSTGMLKILNDIFPDGTNLLVDQVLCLPRKCNVYKVQDGDTCSSIASSQRISVTDLLKYNPTLNSACSNLIISNNICIGPSGTQYTPTTIAGATATKTNQYATATVSPDSTTAGGTTDKCGKYHKVSAGDTCEQISLKYSISVDLFLAINPSAGRGCSFLSPGIEYCVFPMQNWNATTGSNMTTSTYITAPGPTPTGSTSKCYSWHTVEEGDDCAKLEAIYGVSFGELQAWNPQINSICSNLLLDAAYCVKGVSMTAPSSTPASSTPTSSGAPPGPTQSGIAGNCNSWVMQKDGIYCADMADNAGIKIDELYKWNSALNGDCSGLWPNYAYCVGVST
ncbi:hypothetical protein SI65_08985 [Aspergillus cristatus]|uniref:LysM domain-containing protein n=1 Tax=Aspergillus cristatus TaxID=573508 RepID=A0A1E3B4K7_ASPCR|nr:hypothetical protein SI65_08985 [Aspergillus cristatus]